MERDEILNRVKRASQNIMPDLDIDKVKVDAHFRDELGLDSVDAMSLIIALEEEFGIAIPDAEVKEITTFEQAAAMIEKYLSATS